MEWLSSGLIISAGVYQSSSTGCLLPATILPVPGLLVIILSHIPNFMGKSGSSRDESGAHLQDLKDLPQQYTPTFVNRWKWVTMRVKKDLGKTYLTKQHEPEAEGCIWWRRETSNFALGVVERCSGLIISIRTSTLFLDLQSNLVQSPFPQIDLFCVLTVLKAWRWDSQWIRYEM